MSVLPPHDPVTDRAAALIGELATHKTDEPMLAEPMERLTARLVDAVVWFVAGTFFSSIAAVASQLFFGGSKTDGYGNEIIEVSPAAAWAAFVAMLVALFLYEAPATARTGAHFAKRRWNLIVVGPDGGPPGFRRAALRWAAFWLPLTGSMLFFGLTFGGDYGFVALAFEAAALAMPALAFVREDKRNVADLIAGTRVLAAR